MAPQKAQMEDPKPGTSAGNNGEGAGSKEDGPKGKQGPRKRVSQACDKCRSRKDKCDGKKPACSTCITNGRTCSYDTNVKKRGLPEGYVRGLEKFWGLAIKDVESVEDQMLVALAGNEDSNESPLSVWNDESTSEALVETWRKSQLSRELERLLSAQEPTVDTKRKRLGSDIQPPKRIDRMSFSQTSAVKDGGQDRPNIIGARWPESGFNAKTPDEFPRPPPSSHSYQDNSPFVTKEVESILSPSNAHTTISKGTPATSVDIPELPSETWHLIDVYFSYTHSWLPIIEKHDLLRTSYQYSQNRGGSSMSGSGSGEHAVLWAAIAYAKFQHRAINNIPRALGPVGEMVWTAERMYAQARSLIPNEEGVLELGHVQALLILTLANMGMGFHSRAWSLIGQAVRTAMDLQLDQPPDPVANLLKAKTRSKHVILGCFALDTLIAARLSRKPHLRAHDIDQVGLVEEDGLEEWDPWTDCLNVRRNKSGGSRGPSSILSTFNRCIEVLKILNEATCLPSGSNGQQLSTVLLEKLHIWSHSQSSPLYFDSSAVESEAANLLPHQYHLHNVYFTTLATSQLLSHVTLDSSVNLEPCTRSARQIVDLLTRHSHTFGLLIVPPTYEFFVNKAYDIVRAVNSSIESTHIVLNDWKRSLDHCLDGMEPAWPVFESLKTNVAYQSTSHARRESQVAYELLGGMNQDSDTPMSGRTPQSMASHDTMGAYSPQIFRPQTENVQQARGSQSGKGPAKVAHRPSFGQSSGHGLPTNPLSIYENAHVTFGGLDRRLDKAAGKAPSRQPVGRPTIDLTQPSNPQLHRSLTMSSADVEFDPMTGNWDQSLMNLGFTDTGNMNQDFYAFCQEPDPLHQNNVFQQLVANSNAENTDFFDGSGLNGMNGSGMSGGAGMGAFGGMGIGDENEGIEAGQILQALSAAEDHRSVRENG
ncbi:related to quinic acid utilization activator [Phialocephala subalpina]|uniref:Related to quinic acid utilization activator n=1 Tax=Phialocephala subalpina TaxID=576137 RepID=A0A1L7XGE4_9HELO|nr:related to quinic acid utilization activator [Phialocephala subalpina]